MNLSMISRNHFRSVKKATTTSNRIQGRKMEGELAVDKRGSVCLILTRLNRGQSSSFGPGVSSIPGFRGWILALLKSRGQLQAGHCPKQCPKTQKSVLKLWKGDNQSQRSCGKLQWGTAQDAMPDTPRSWLRKLQRKYLTTNDRVGPP